MSNSDYNYANWKMEAKEFWEKAQKNIVCDEGEVIKRCVCLAFRDLTVRTMKKKEGIDKPIVLDELAKECCEEKEAEKTYLQFIEEWVERTEEPTKESFLGMHESLCNIVTKCLKTRYEEDYCTYGKAQKIVNMTFKYLYAYCCVNPSEIKNEKCFEFCHMPLDSFTLEWFSREITKVTNIMKTKIGSWSNMGKKDDEKSYGYEFYYKEIEKYFKKHEITPLQAEFVIWPHIQKLMATEAFIFAFKPDLSNYDKAAIRKKDLKEKIVSVREILDSI